MKDGDINLTKLIIINQHASNRGDESALRGLLERIDPTRHEITILYSSVRVEGTFQLGQKVKKSVLSEPMTRYEKLFLLLSFFLPLYLIYKIHILTHHKEEYE